MASACPVTAAHYAGRFGDERVVGTVSFATKDGICVGDIVLDKHLADYFNPFPQRDALKLRVVGIDAAGGLSRAALVTPIGVYDLRAQPDGSHSARFGPKRVLSLTFE